MSTNSITIDHGTRYKAILRIAARFFLTGQQGCDTLGSLAMGRARQEARQAADHGDIMPLVDYIERQL